MAESHRQDDTVKSFKQPTVNCRERRGQWRMADDYTATIAASRFEPPASAFQLTGNRKVRSNSPAQTFLDADFRLVIQQSSSPIEIGQGMPNIA